MKPRRKMTLAQEDAVRERFACPVCSGRNLDEETTLLGGIVRIRCTDCGYCEDIDPRRRKTA